MNSSKYTWRNCLIISSWRISIFLVGIYATAIITLIYCGFPLETSERIPEEVPEEFRKKFQEFPTESPKESTKEVLKKIQEQFLTQSQKKVPGGMPGEVPERIMEVVPGGILEVFEAVPEVVP